MGLALATRGVEEGEEERDDEEVLHSNDKRVFSCPNRLQNTRNRMNHALAQLAHRCRQPK